MPFTDNSNILFILSGQIPGLYQFEQNPATYNIVPQLQLYTTFNTLQSKDIIQKPFVDNEIREMTWEKASRNLYLNLKAFSERDIFGNIPISYFWDGPVFEIQGTSIQVIDVIGEPLGGMYDYWKIRMQIKATQIADKTYGMNTSYNYFPSGITIYNSWENGAWENALWESIDTISAGSGNQISARVPNLNYTFDLYDSKLNTIIPNNLKNFSNNLWIVDITTISGLLPNASKIVFKNKGWVVCKRNISGVQNGNLFTLV